MPNIYPTPCILCLNSCLSGPGIVELTVNLGIFEVEITRTGEVVDVRGRSVERKKRVVIARELIQVRGNFGWQWGGRTDDCLCGILIGSQGNRWIG